MPKSNPTEAPVADSQAEVKVRNVRISLCELCLEGKGQVCHTPGCALCRHASPGFPIMPEAYKIVPPEEPADTEQSIQDIIDKLPIYHRARREWELYTRLRQEAEDALSYRSRWNEAIDESVFCDLSEVLSALKDF